MATINEADSTEDAGSNLSNVLSEIRGSTLLMLAMVGVAEIIFAGLIELALQNNFIGEEANLSGFMADLFSDGNLWGLWAAVFGIWGTGLILVGVAGYSLVWFRRR